MDRFRTPGADELISGLSETDQAIFRDVREQLLTLEDISESILWHGLPWRWAFAYRTGGQSEAEPATAYLVPNPELPQLGLPLSVGFVAGLKPRRLSRPSRERLVHATRVAGLLWTEWDLTSRAPLTEAIELLREAAGETAETKDAGAAV